MRSSNSLLVFAIGVLCMSVALAVVLVNGGGTAFSSVNASTVAVYNFSSNNTQAVSNVTEVNVTLPTGFVFVSGTNATDVAVTGFTNTSTVLSWTNASLVLNGSLQYFFFNATSTATPGAYNFTITVSNSSGVFETQNLSVTVLAQVTLIYPTNTSYATAPTQLNFSQFKTNFDSAWYSNDSGVTNYSIQTNDSNFTGLATVEGLNNWTVYVNDSSGSENSSIVFFTVDTTDPVATAACSPSSTNLGATVTCTCSGTDGGSGVNAALTTAGSTPSTVVSGTFSYSCSVTDNVGNTDTANASFTILTSSTSGGTNTVYPTYRPSESVLSAGYSVSLSRGSKVNFNLKGGAHSLVVNSVLADSVTITVSSTPVTLTLEIGETKMLDLNEDGTVDLEVEFMSVSSGKAKLVLLSIEDGPAVPVETEADGLGDAVDEVVGEDEETAMSKTALGIIIIGIIIAFVFFSAKPKEIWKKK